jgi:hypothetical protein
MRILLASALSLLLISAGPAAKSPQNTKITGDYVEARTASVFAGACHYNGELVTTGRDAVMAWNFTAGRHNGIDLAGVRAMAAVSADQNLGQDNATRKIELVIDSAASSAQAAAVADLLRAQLGQVAAVRRAPVTFTRDADNQYTVNSEGFATISVRPMPNRECCAQPNLVWYSPLFAIENRKVGYTQTAGYAAGKVGDTWQRDGENSAFYGSFSF